MKISRKFQEEPEVIQMTPLIDIVFLTLVFFLVTSVYGALESQVDIQLPTADSAVDRERDQGEIFINLRADGSIVVNEREMDIEELERVLERVAMIYPGGAVILRGDRNAVLGRAVEIFDACRKADIQNISIATMSEDETVDPVLE